MAKWKALRSVQLYNSGRPHWLAVLWLLSALLLSACSGSGGDGGNPNNPNNPAELKDPQLTFQSAPAVTLKVGSIQSNTASSGTGSTGSISYTSQDASVAEVDPDSGEVTAKTIGTTTITATITKTSTHQSGSASYVLAVGGTLRLWLGENGAQWQMPKGFSGADFYGTTEANCPYDLTGDCANATIISDLADGALFDDDGSNENALSLQQSTAFYQLTRDKHEAQGLVSTDRWARRKDQQMVYYQDRFWVLGGRASLNNQMSVMKDVWSSPDGKNWQQHDDFLEPARAGHQVVAYDFNDGIGEQLVLIAGGAGTGKKDFLRFNASAAPGDQWRRKSDVPFAPREEHQLVVFNGRLWVIGGLDKDNGNARLNDVWFFELAGAGSGRWEKHSEDKFPGRYQHQAVVFDGKLWVMGGLDANDNPLNDVWVLDAEETSWEDKTTATGADQFDALKRANFQLAVFNNRLWLIGGKADVNGDVSLNDVWSLGKGAGATWRQELEQAPFAVRNGHQVVIARGRMWLFGGGKGDTNSGSNVNDVKNDVWSTADGKHWRQESAGPEFGARRSHQVVAFAPTDAEANLGERRLWLVGGTGGQPTNEVWSSLDGVNWALATDAALFEARYDHSLAEFDGRLWLVGGRDANDETLGKVWSSADGVEWRDEAELLPGNFPALAESQLVVFNNELWLFGGEGNNGTATNEVWSLSQGADTPWQKRQSSFPSRRNHQIVVFNNGSSDQLVMSGGFQNGTQNDVWVSSNGLQWDKPSDQSSSLYSQRDRHQMVVIDGEPSQAQILILIGGTSDDAASGAVSDIWASTDGGLTWEQKDSDAPFGKVLNHQVVTFNDGTGDKLWLIGGEFIGNQIWRSEDGINWQKLQKSDFQFAEPDSSPTP